MRLDKGSSVLYSELRGGKMQLVSSQSVEHFLHVIEISRLKCFSAVKETPITSP